MVAASERITYAGFEDNYRCMPIKEATERGERHGGIQVWPRAYQILEAADVDLDLVNIHVADQPIRVDVSGCTTDQDHTYQTERLVVVDCPREQAEKCGSCILEMMEKGGDLQERLKSRQSPEWATPPTVYLPPPNI